MTNGSVTSLLDIHIVNIHCFHKYQTGHDDAAFSTNVSCFSIFHDQIQVFVFTNADELQ